MINMIEILNLNTHQVTKQSEYFEKPDDNNNDNYNIQDIFDFMIHWDVRIDKPEQNTDNNNDK